MQKYFMESLMKKSSIILGFILLLCINTIYSQHEEHSSEINSSVKELYDFHEVIYPIWHTAYPNKDYILLKELLPKVNEGAKNIYDVNLPGILRDKEEAWNYELKLFSKAIDLYNITCLENNDSGMLNAAEQLHSSFEKLVRIIKPVTKEVDEFHKVLYMIYHHYSPENNTDELNKAVDDLYLRADELKNCVLPKWASDKEKDFFKAVDELHKSTKELKELKDSNVESQRIESAIDRVHKDYQELEALFD